MKIRKSYSFVVALLLGAAIVFSALRTPPRITLSYDVFGYYLYLPSLFIYHDFNFDRDSYVNNILEKYKNSPTFYQVTTASDGSRIIRYSAGLAMLYLPFFLLGHLYASLSSFPADGFSRPYEMAIFLGCLFYSLLGIFLARKVLLKFFNDRTTAVVLLLAILGTNYFYTAAFKGPMSHNLLFTLYAAILLLTISWFEKPGKVRAFFLGFFLGLVILSRPSEIVCLAIPLLWGVYNKKSLQEQVSLFKKRIPDLILAAAGIMIAWIPQVVYWKIFSGEFFFYSYNNPAEGFDFLRPYTLKTLFSFRKGWLIYTPMMTFSLAGLYLMYKNKRAYFWPLFIYFLLNLYIVSAWSVWWYAESFGQRALVQSYAVLLIPFGFFIQWTNRSKRVIKWLVYTLAVFFMMLNQFQIWQLKHGILDASRMTMPYYFRIFGKTHASEEDRKRLLIKRGKFIDEHLENEVDYNRKQLLYLDFEDPKEAQADHYDTTYAYSGRHSFRMDSSLVFSPGYGTQYKDLVRNEYAWLRAKVRISPADTVSSLRAILVVSFDHKGGIYKYRTASLSGNNDTLVPGRWYTLSIDYLTPEVRSYSDRFSVYVWNPAKQKFYIDGLEVDLFEPNDYH